MDSIKKSNKKNILIDSAKLYYEKLESFSGLNSNIETLKAKAFSNLSAIYEQDSDYIKAENYINKAIKIHKQNKNDLYTVGSLINLGNIFLTQQDYKKSKKIYLEALDLIKYNNKPY